RFALAVHLNESDDDNAVEVAKADLAADFRGRFHIDGELGGATPGACRPPGRIYIVHGKRLAWLNNDVRARRKGEAPAKRALDPGFDLHRLEQIRRLRPEGERAGGHLRMRHAVAFDAVQRRDIIDDDVKAGREAAIEQEV